MEISTVIVVLLVRFETARPCFSVHTIHVDVRGFGEEKHKKKLKYLKYIYVYIYM